MKNPNQRKGGCCIIIRVKVLGKFGGWFEPGTIERDYPSLKIIRKKEVIFGQVTYSTYSVV